LGSKSNGSGSTCVENVVDAYIEQMEEISEEIAEAAKNDEEDKASKFKKQKSIDIS
jgi:hypothetical protein